MVLIAVTGIGGYKLMGKSYRCKVSQAISLFSFSGDKGSSSNCDDESGGPQASNSPPPSGGGSGSAGPTAGVTCVGSSCTPGSNQCFVAGTLVMTERGLAPIEAITVGTKILSRDQEGDVVDWKPVVRTFAHRERALVALTVGDEGSRETIEVTPGHRVYAEARGWVAVAELVPGQDALVDSRGVAIAVDAAESIAGEQSVYNLEIEGFHTYFVGQHSMWVHNDCGQGHPSWVDCPSCGTGSYGSTYDVNPDRRYPPSPPTAPPQDIQDAYNQYNGGTFQAFDNQRYPIPHAFPGDGCWGCTEMGQRVVDPRLNPRPVYVEPTNANFGPDPQGNGLRPPPGPSADWLAQQNQAWQYHVALGVQDSNGKNYVLDPVSHDRPVSFRRFVDNITPQNGSSQGTIGYQRPVGDDLRRPIPSAYNQYDGDTFGKIAAQSSSRPYGDQRADDNHYNPHPWGSNGPRPVSGSEGSKTNPRPFQPGQVTNYGSRSLYVLDRNGRTVKIPAGATQWF